MTMDSSSSNTVTGNTCNNNDSWHLQAVRNNTVTGNTCIRGTGLAMDYTASQHMVTGSWEQVTTITISNNNCWAKLLQTGEPGNTLQANSMDSDDIQALVTARFALVHQQQVTRRIAAYL